MDAHALLTSQGWRGTGNSLHPTNNSIGLSKPLLVSQKQNNLGLGKKQHKTSDMWWMNAFDSSLKGLDTSKQGSVVQTVTSGGLDMVAKGGSKWVGSAGGLYASFVRGESLSGTITPKESTENAVTEKYEQKRKWVADEQTEEERRARKAAKKSLKEQESKNTVQANGIAEKTESKEERRAWKLAKRASRAQKVAAVGDPAEIESAKAEIKEGRKERKRALREQELAAAMEELVDANESTEPDKKKKSGTNENRKKRAGKQ